MASSGSGALLGIDPCDPCDMNCDTFHDDFDIPIFVDALVRGTSLCSTCTGDLDDNGLFDGRDIQIFVECMLGRMGPSVVILQNGTVVPNPAYPYRMEAYGEGDLPDLRAFADAAGIFAGIDMNADWKDREWEMIQAIRVWIVRNVRMSAVGQNSKHDLTGRAISFFSSLAERGQLVAWGDDDRYGNVSGVSDLSPNSGFVAVDAGIHHSLALRRTGEVEAWGRNQFGQGTEPILNTGYIAISAGANHNLALNRDGTIFAWGQKESGQCDIPEPNADFVGIAAGIKFSMGLKSDGTVVVWGILPTDVLLNEEWQGHFIKVAAGGYHCVGLLDDGTVVAWGDNSTGQCVVPTHLGSFPLQDRILDIGAGKRRSYATVDLGSGIVSWGAPLDQGFLPGGRFRFVWPSPTHKYLLTSRATVPNDQVVIDRQITVPTPSSNLALAYDSDLEVVVKFGGSFGLPGPGLDETFEWDGREWDNIAPTIRPSIRSGHCMAYDALRKRVIMWGRDGSAGGQARDAWEWDGNNWAGPFAASGASRPSAYRDCRAIWDPSRGTAPAGRVTIFFGRGSSTVYETAFDYDPVTHTFESRDIGGSPGARYSFGLAYDSVRDKIVRFGGANSLHIATNDTREAPAGGTGTTTFSLVVPATTTPSPRYEHAMVYDAARAKIVMYGGQNGSTFYDDTWEWDGADWTLKSPENSPGQLAGHEMVYDEEHQVVVLFGGIRNGGVSVEASNETWEWDGTDWKQRNLTTIPEGAIPDVSSTDFVYVGYATGSQFGIGLLDQVWSCGAIQQMFSGLCVAHGIPARRVEGWSLGCAADTIVEAFSTRWNKWILFWHYTGNWVENAAGIPLSQAEMRAHYAAADYSISPGYELEIGRRGWRATAQNDSGLVFQPNAVCTAPLHPRIEARWWSDTLKVNPVSPADDHDHFERNFTTSLTRAHQPNPTANIVLLNDYTDIDAICGTNLSSNLMSFDGDPNLTYPINNVQAEAELVQETPPKVRITLQHNMVVGTGEFSHYEKSLDNGQTWTELQALLGVYDWYPTGSAILMIRGVNDAGVHSPDVVIQFSAAGATGT